MSYLTHPRRGAQVVVVDNGPGIEDFDASLQDGYSEGRLLSEEEPGTGTGSRRGLGSGLGAVKRLMDELTAESPPDGGLKIVARKWLSR